MPFHLQVGYIPYVLHVRMIARYEDFSCVASRRGEGGGKVCGSTLNTPLLIFF